MNFWQSHESHSAIEWFLRAIIMFSWLLLVARFMGQRQIGRLTAFDFIVYITFGGIAAGTLNNPRTNILGAMISIGTFGLTNVCLANVSLKYSKIRRILQEEPLILVQNGRILEKMLKKTRINLDDLLFELRLKNIFDLSDVDFVILEPNGKLSIISTPDASPVQKRDMKIISPKQNLPTVLIEDGHVVEDNLKTNNLNMSWLQQELTKLNIHNPSDVMVAMLDSKREFYAARKHESFNHQDN